MKTLSKWAARLFVMCLLAAGAVACSDDEVTDPNLSSVADSIPFVREVLVWDEAAGGYSDQVQARVGLQVKLNGDYLDRVDTVFFNGLAVLSSDFIGQNSTSIETLIPEETPVGSKLDNEYVRNTVRVVAGKKSGNTKLLNILSGNLGVTGIYIYEEDGTLAAQATDRITVGDKIQIQGEGMEYVTDVTVNGQEITEWTIVSSGAIDVAIPENLPVGSRVEDEEKKDKIYLETEFKETMEYRIPVLAHQPVASAEAIASVGKGEEVTLKGEHLGVAETIILQVEGEEESISVDELTINTEGTEIKFVVPSSVKAGVVTAILAPDFLDVVTWKFNVLGAKPTVDRVSHTLAKAGERIRIYGDNLVDVVKVEFPHAGDADIPTASIRVETENELDGKGEFWYHEAEDGSYQMIDVIIPDGGDETAGALYVEAGEGNGDYSCSYINCRENIFISEFDESADAFTSGKNFSKSQFPSVSREGLWPSQPEYVGAFGDWNNGKGIDCTVTASGSDPTVDGSLKESQINFSNSEMRAKAPAGVTNCNDLALQMDCFVEHDGGQYSWITGAMRWKLGNSDRDIQFTPWHKDYNEANKKDEKYKEVDMDFSTGWKTLTFPLGDDDTWTKDKVLSEIVGDAYFRFVFGRFLVPKASGENNWDAGQSVTNFKIYFGNFRIVPYTRPDAE